MRCTARLVAVKRKQGHPEPIYVIPKSVVAGMKPQEKKRFHELETQIARLDQTWGFCSPAASDHPLVVAPHEMRWPLPRDGQVLAARRTHLLIRGDVKSPGPELTAGWPSVFGLDPGTAGTTTNRARRLADRPFKSADRTRLGQPNLAVAFWPRPGRNQQRLWHARQRSVAPGIARLPCQRTDRQRLEYQAHAAFDCRFGSVSAVVPVFDLQLRRSIPKTDSYGVGLRGGWKRKPSVIRFCWSPDNYRQRLAARASLLTQIAAASICCSAEMICLTSKPCSTAPAVSSVVRGGASPPRHCSHCG